MAFCSDLLGLKGLFSYIPVSSFGQVEELQKSRQVPHLSGAIRCQTYKVKQTFLLYEHPWGYLSETLKLLKWAYRCNPYMFNFEMYGAFHLNFSWLLMVFNITYEQRNVTF